MPNVGLLCENVELLSTGRKRERVRERGERDGERGGRGRERKYLFSVSVHICIYVYICLYMHILFILHVPFFFTFSYGL